MQSKANVWVVAACLTSLWLLASCDTRVVHRRHHPGIGNGPPVHAKAYGHRNKYVCGHELTYDADCGVYVVVGITDCYYHEGYFYRHRGDVWEISLRADTWEPAGYEKLPPGLRIKTKPVVASHGGRPMKLNGNGNSVVKLNGNGNSAVKLNGGGGSLLKQNGHSNGKGKSAAKGRK